MEDVINNVCDELGLAKVLSRSGGGTIDYVIEEVSRDGELEGAISRIFVISRVINV